MARVWTCQRVTAGVKCRTVNPRVKQRCVGCGKPRPKPSRPAHMQALDLSYEDFIALNGGEHCGICGRGPSARRLHRDHDHATGVGRGLLCFRCNSALRAYMTVEWLRAALAYLERART